MSVIQNGHGLEVDFHVISSIVNLDTNVWFQTNGDTPMSFFKPSCIEKVCVTLVLFHLLKPALYQCCVHVDIVNIRYITV